MFPIAPVNTVQVKAPLEAPKPIDATAIAGSKAVDNQPAAVVAPIEPSEKLRQPEVRRRPQPPSPLENALANQAEGNVDDPAKNNTVRNVEIDPETNSVIFQSISQRTGQVVIQVPTETFLRIREFADTITPPPLGTAEQGNR